jgi:hypothetical protein
MFSAGEYIAAGESRTVTILPLIERELRVRARSRAVYWMRFAVALVGILICLPTLVMTANPWGGSQAALGQYAFNGLVFAAFFLCCCAGLLTADSISRERREGTLGLLFLTRVKIFDVLLGSFGSTGITCVCALIACLPVLILPVLTGGVTGGEAFRQVLVLFDTLFFSLAAGLWASARGRGWFKSARSAALLLVFLIVFPFLTHPLAVGFSRWFDAGFLSPLVAMDYAADASYRVIPASYWLSIASVHGISWLLLLGAGARLRCAMREEDGTKETSATANREATALQQRRSKPLEEGMDPIAWLVRRQRGIKGVIWAAALVGAGFYVVVYSGIWSRARSFAYSFRGLSLADSVVEGCLFAWAASRFFVEARRSGELEILLSTPLGANTIVASQWNWLRRLLFWPLLVLIAPIVAQAAFYMGWAALPVQFRWPVMISQSLYCVNLVIGTGALFWMGLWFGLKARSQAGAILRTVLLAKGAPYLISLLLSSFSRIVVSTSGRPAASSWILWSVSPLVNLCLYLWLIRWARRRLRAELAHDGPAPLKPACLKEKQAAA